MSVPAGQMGGLQGAVNSGRYLSQGSPFAEQLLAKLLAAAGGSQLGSLSRPQNLAYRQAAQQALPVPRTMLSSVLGHAGLMPRGDFRFRNMGSGVRPSPEAIAASYGLSGYPTAPPPVPASAPPVPGFQGPYAGPPASGSGGPMGVPTPGVDPYAQLTAAMLNPRRGAWGRRVYR